MDKPSIQAGAILMSVTITTSWDDGHILDRRVADVLERYGLTGTFYIARDFLDERMSETQLHELAQRHEIGAHTLTHPILTEIPLAQAQAEITGSKAWLEDVTGQAVTAFCYPRGAHNPTLQGIVRDAGFTMARTVEKFSFDSGDNPYVLPTTLQIYPYPLRPLPHLSRLRGWRTRLNPFIEVWSRRHVIKLKPLSLLNWVSLAKSLLHEAAQQGAIWHLWGHSWEIERYDLWHELEQICQIVSDRQDIRPVINSQLIERVKSSEK